MDIKLTIDRFENEQAVLKTEDGQTVIWPKPLLPDNLAEGDVLNFRIGKDGETTASRQSEAKDILNELLKTD